MVLVVCSSTMACSLVIHLLLGSMDLQDPGLIEVIGDLLHLFVCDFVMLALIELPKLACEIISLFAWVCVCIEAIQRKFHHPHACCFTLQSYSLTEASSTQQ